MASEIETGPKTEAKGGTRIAAMNNFLNKVTCSVCGASVGEGRLKLVSSRVDDAKVVFTYKCFNEIEKKNFLGQREEGLKPCGNMLKVEVPEHWTK